MVAVEPTSSSKNAKSELATDVAFLVGVAADPLTAKAKTYFCCVLRVSGIARLGPEDAESEPPSTQQLPISVDIQLALLPTFEMN